MAYMKSVIRFSMICLSIAMAINMNAAKFCDQQLLENGAIKSSCITEGTVSWDENTKTLTFDNAKVTFNESSTVISGENINIVIKGACSMSCPSGWGISAKKVTIKGTNNQSDSFEIITSKLSISFTHLWVSNVTLNLSSGSACAYGDQTSTEFSTMTLTNVRGEFYGEPAISNVYQIIYEGTRITDPDPTTIRHLGARIVYRSDNYTTVNTIKIGPSKGTDPIVFDDDDVKAKCVAKWDKNKDGELSRDEAAAVTAIGSEFSGTKITKFDELQYFTGLTRIDYHAFYQCNQLKTAVIPINVNLISTYAFAETGALISVAAVINNHLQAIADGAFENSGIKAFHNASALQTIGKSVFNGCSQFKKFEFPNTLTSVGNQAFKGTSNLKSGYLPKSLTTIGDEAFMGNGLINSQTLGNVGKGLYVGTDAFVGCTFKDIYILGDPTIKNCFFHDSGIYNVYIINRHFNWARKTLSTSWTESQRNSIKPLAVVDQLGFSPVYFNVDVQLPSKTKAYIVNGFSADTKEVTLYPISSLVPAGTPFLVQVPEDYDFALFSIIPSTETPPTNNFLVGNNELCWLKPAPATYIYNMDHSRFELIDQVDERKNLLYASTAYLQFPGGCEGIPYFNIQGFKPVIKGDVNGDGEVNTSDVTALVNHILGNETWPMERADVDSNGIVNVSDVTALIAIILSM